MCSRLIHKYVLQLYETGDIIEDDQQNEIWENK